jgi:probable rRNA maturation factor
MPVTVLSRCRLSGASAATVRRRARRLLGLLGEAADLTVSLVDDPEMQRLNARYRGADRPTDVLAFAMREGRRAPGDERLLGDVVISLPTAAAQARPRRCTVADEVTTLLIHGVLHLLGYDHERSAAEARRMRRKERELQRALRTPVFTRPRAARGRGSAAPEAARRGRR